MARYYQDVVEELDAASEYLDKLWLEQKDPKFHDLALVCADAAYQLRQLRQAKTQGSDHHV